MSDWISIEPNQVVQVLDTGGILWEHDTLQPYPVQRHLVLSADGARWTVAAADPLSLNPSVHCDKARGGCGLHGFITAGRFS